MTKLHVEINVVWIILLCLILLCLSLFTQAQQQAVTTTGGTVNTVPLFTTATNIQNSLLTQTGTTMNIAGNLVASGRLAATGGVSSRGFLIGSNLFAYGSFNSANAFLGFAGNTTTIGTNDTATGRGALSSNTSGLGNTAIGSEALFTNTFGSYNTAVGYNALLLNNNGTGNTAIGFAALENNVAYGNTATGYQALYNNTGDATGDGSYDTAFGYQALYSNNNNGNTTGESQYNSAFGHQALYSNTLGSSNTAVGVAALYSNTGDTSGNGYDNTAIGGSALYNNTLGSENTAVGVDALYSNTTGTFLTCVGVGCTVSADALTNATALGAHAVVGQSNSLVLGGTGEYGVKVGIGTTTPSNVLTIGRGLGHPVSDSWETYSSRRWKTNIKTLPDALSKVQQLRGVSYDLKDSGKHEIGVIAEEVGQVVPEVVSYEQNSKDATGVDYSRLTALLIEAVKQQQREIRDLKSALRATRQTLQKVKAQVDATQPSLVATK